MVEYGHKFLYLHSIEALAAGESIISSLLRYLLSYRWRSLMMII